MTCPDCGVALAPFLNPDGSAPPGPHTCPHMIFVIVEGGPSPESLMTPGRWSLIAFRPSDETTPTGRLRKAP